MRRVVFFWGLVTACLSTQAALLPRDLNADGVADAYYDSAQGITWLADGSALANDAGHFANESGLVQRGVAATSWAASLDVHGVTGWRLPKQFFDWSGVPTVPAKYGGGADCDIAGAGCLLPDDIARSEMSLVFGKGSAGLPFRYIWEGSPYWWLTDTTGSMHVALLYEFGRDTFASLNLDQRATASAWAVHDGDIGSPIPEPDAWALMAFGAALVLSTRYRRA